MDGEHIHGEDLTFSYDKAIPSKFVYPTAFNMRLGR